MYYNYIIFYHEDYYNEVASWKFLGPTNFQKYSQMTKHLIFLNAFT